MAMGWSVFIRNLAALVSLSIVLGYILHMVLPILAWSEFYTFSSASFILFTIFIFFYANRVSDSNSLYSFNAIVTWSFLIKLIMAIGILLLFREWVTQVSRRHIIHFIGIYILYTAYEVYFLTKLARRGN